MLKIAIQKAGRLHEDSVTLLRECGIRVNNNNGQLKASVFNFPMEVFFLRDDDIPQYVADGVADAGIVGENILVEKAAKVDNVCRLGFGQCRLSIAVPRNSTYRYPSDLKGKRIATSYPHTLTRFLAKKNIKADIHVISGSVEIAPASACLTPSATL